MLGLTAARLRHQQPCRKVYWGRASFFKAIYDDSLVHGGSSNPPLLYGSLQRQFIQVDSLLSFPLSSQPPSRAMETVCFGRLRFITHKRSFSVDSILSKRNLPKEFNSKLGLWEHFITKLMKWLGLGGGHQKRVEEHPWNSDTSHGDCQLELPLLVLRVCCVCVCSELFIYNKQM